MPAKITRLSQKSHPKPRWMKGGMAVTGGLIIFMFAYAFIRSIFI